MNNFLIFVMLVNGTYANNQSTFLKYTGRADATLLVSTVDKPSARPGCFIMEIVNLREWVPYNEYIGDPDCTDTHLVEVIEEWKDVPGYENLYQVSTFGRVKGLDRPIRTSKNGLKFQLKKGQLLVPVLQNKYHSVTLCRPNFIKSYRIHRLVAIVYIPNPENKPEVNHKKGNKFNNRVWMLEWNTSSENTQHAFDIGLINLPTNKFKGQRGAIHPNSKKVYLYNSDGEYLRKYNSTNHAAIELNISPSTVGGYCNGKFKNKLGYIFTYIKKSEMETPKPPANKGTITVMDKKSDIIFRSIILDEKDPVQLTPELIREKSKSLTDLKILDIFDEAGYTAVKKAKAKAVKTRTTIEKLQKSHLDDLKSAYENKKKEITDYTAELYAACREAENTLQGKLTAHEEAKAAAQKKLEEERLGKTTAREARMYELGMAWNGQNFVGYAKFIGKDFLFGLSDESYDGLVSELAGLQMQAGITGAPPAEVPQATLNSLPASWGTRQDAEKENAEYMAEPFKPFANAIYDRYIPEHGVHIFITSGPVADHPAACVANDEINSSGYFVTVITR